ncbi:MAG: hypothetical protein IJ301_02240 [Clostridia bacterium]|nr:hypothetical protein [Clostridia bacterium]
MNIVVFDTETTNLEKPFCYNIGYVIFDTDNDQIVLRREFVVEQVWHNPMLFTTAYYADKRELYISRMKGRKITMDKFGYVCQQMIRDFQAYEIKFAYAYNSGFDEKVFEWNCDWFKCNNPFDNIEILDIRGLVHQKVAFTKAFQDFCEREKRFTESGNYSTTVETLFQFVAGDNNFQEEHTALADSEIECEILRYCVDLGCEYGKKYKTYQSIKRDIDKVLTIEQVDKDGNKQVDEIIYKSRRNYKDESGQICRIVLKSE